MPSEDRRIIFNYEELYKAIYSLATQKSMKRPMAGVIVQAEYDEQDSSLIHFQIQNPQEWEGTRKLDYSRDFVAAAMMLYCRGVDIPIPRKARKSVLFEDKHAILRVEISIN